MNISALSIFGLLFLLAALFAGGCGPGGIGSATVGVVDNPGYAATGAGIAIAAVTPAASFQGDTITIAGSGFGVEKGDGSIVIGGYSATEKTWSDTAITVTVPSSSATGRITIKNNSGNSVSTSQDYPIIKWESQTTSSSNSFYGVAFASAAKGWTANDRRMYTYGENSWSSSTIADRVFRSVSAVNATLAWSAGSNSAVAIGYAYRTQDAGATWSDKGPAAASPLNGVWFASATTGWVVGDGKYIRQTTNGDVVAPTWNVQSCPADVVTSNLRAVHFLNDGATGWIVGSNGVIINTIDAGANWIRQAVPASVSAVTFNAVRMVDAATGWAVGNGGAVLRYSGGVWSIVDIGTAMDLNAVYFINANEGCIGGDGGALFATSDGGATWRLVASGTTDDITGLCILSSTMGWLTATGSVRYLHIVY